jgi:hypothetical protein
MHDGVPAHFQSMSQIDGMTPKNGSRRQSQVDLLKQKSRDFHHSIDQVKTKTSKPSSGPSGYVPTSAGGPKVPRKKGQKIF